MNLVIILVSNPNRMMLNPNVMSLLQVIDFIVFFSIFTYLLGGLLLLQLSKIESGCLLNQFLMWFKDYEKLQHLLLSIQTLNRKSEHVGFTEILILYLVHSIFSVLRTFTTLQPSSMLKLSSTNTNDDSSSKPIVVDYFDFDG